eukprot:CCRYP_014595-RA/>CCRYP_014595-RA protein AED:0.00 eAED:0.00 QI:17/1/1/1/0/0/2/116/60
MLFARCGLDIKAVQYGIVVFIIVVFCLLVRPRGDVSKNYSIATQDLLNPHLRSVPLQEKI